MGKIESEGKIPLRNYRVGRTKRKRNGEKEGKRCNREGLRERENNSVSISVRS